MCSIVLLDCHVFRVVANYIAWRVLVDNVQFLTRDVRDVYTRFVRQLRKRDYNTKRSEVCANAITDR